MSTYIQKVAKRFSFDQCGSKTSSNVPMLPGNRLSKEQEAQSPDEIKGFPYRELVACLLYIAVCIGPDIAYTVKELSRFLINPGTAMVKAAKQLLRYVIQRNKLGLKFSAQVKHVLGSICKTTSKSHFSAFTDAAFADQKDDLKSTGGCVILFNGCAIHWWSKTIRTVCLSSQDAECDVPDDVALPTCHEHDDVYFDLPFGHLPCPRNAETVTTDGIGSVFIRRYQSHSGCDLLEGANN